MANENEIKQRIREFVIENFLMGDAASMLKDNESFLETGTIDSTGVLEVVTFLESAFGLKVEGVLEVVTFLESAFGLKVEDRDLVPENLDSVNNLAAYVMKGKKHAA